MIARSYATAALTAYHTDPLGIEGRHGHCWKITLYWPSEPFRDGRSIRVSLSRILAPWQGADMPENLWSAEALAKAILQLHGNANIIGIRIDRDEGFGVEIWL